MIKRKASKHKMACRDDEETRNIKAFISDSTMLSKAADKGDFMALRDILENKDLKFSRRCLNAALLKAVEEGKKQIVSLLLSHGACVKEDSQTGSSALLAASGHGYLDIVKLLIKKGAPVNGKNSAGKTALMMAVEKSCCSALILYLLRDCKADINLQDSAGKTVLMLAVELWDYETVWTLFMGEESANNCDEDIRDNDGNTALDLAKRNGSAELLSVFSQSCKDMMAPLSLAAGRNNFDLVRQLVEIYPSCVESLDFGISPLPAAVHGLDSEDGGWDGKIHCSLKLMQFLLQAGVSVNDEYIPELNSLLFAASVGSEEAVQMLLQHKADLNFRGPNGQTALMMAAEKGHTNVVKMLMEAGANLYTRDCNDNNALHMAVKGGNRVCILTLLQQWNNLQLQDIKLIEDYRVLDVFQGVKERWSQLLRDAAVLQEVFCKVVHGSYYQLGLALIEHGVDIDGLSHPVLRSPLSFSLGDLKMLQILLDCGADVNIKERSTGKTALMEASKSGDVSLVRILLKHNADMYAETKYDCYTALSMAIIQNKTDVVTELLDGGMDVNHITQTRQTALLCALTGKNFPLSELLIKRGANVNFATRGGFTILMQTIKSCTVNFSELIITHGADVNAQDDRGETALFHALRFQLNREEKLSLLLQHGADVNHVNMSTQTPLMVVARDSHVDVFRIVMNSKLNINVQDNNGNTALHLAVRFSAYDEKLKDLVSNGADVNIVNSRDETPLLIAVKGLKGPVVKTLLTLGANLDFKDSPNASTMWKGAFDDMINMYSGYDPTDEFDTLVECVETLLVGGCSLDGVLQHSLNKFLSSCIEQGAVKVLQLLIQSGVGPSLLKISYLPKANPGIMIQHISADAIINSTISPVCTAILAGQPEITALFARACFFHEADVEMLQDSRVKSHLESLFSNWHHQSSPVDELCPGNWSLRTWSKLVVRRAVGYGKGMEQRIRTLPIPGGLQDELIYKNISVEAGLAGGSPHASCNANTGLDGRD